MGQARSSTGRCHKEVFSKKLTQEGRNSHRRHSRWRWRPQGAAGRWGAKALLWCCTWVLPSLLLLLLLQMNRQKFANPIPGSHLSFCASLQSPSNLSVSLSLSQMSLESLFIFSFRVCCWRKAFQDFVRKLPRFGSLFFCCWEVIDMNAAFCDSQMGVSRSGDDDGGGSAKICMLEVFFSGT